ncbi:MAG: hypothetical protein ACTHOH_13225 [Lysobacteraceae bacterium]
MHAINNKQFNFHHIAIVELVIAPDPRTGTNKAWHSFNIVMGNGHIEKTPYKTVEDRTKKWEGLINAMEEAGL